MLRAGLVWWGSRGGFRGGSAGVPRGFRVGFRGVPRGFRGVPGGSAPMLAFQVEVWAHDSAPSALWFHS